MNGNGAHSNIDSLIANANINDLFGERSLRSKVREFFGDVSELPIFENKYYDVFRTPLDTFQERFPEGSRFGWRDESGDWVETDTATLYDLWRKTDAPRLEERPYKRSMTAPREFAFSNRPNKLQKSLGYLFGSPRIIFGTEDPRYFPGMSSPEDLVSELSHQVMWENPQKYGSRRQQIQTFEKIGESREGMTKEEEMKEYYDKPGTPEYIAHREVEPRIIEWLKGL